MRSRRYIHLQVFGRVCRLVSLSVFLCRFVLELVSIRLWDTSLILGKKTFRIILKPGVESYCISPFVVQRVGKWNFLLAVGNDLSVTFLFNPKIVRSFPFIYLAL